MQSIASRRIVQFAASFAHPGASFEAAPRRLRTRWARALRIGGYSRGLFEEAAELVDVFLGHNGNGNVDARVDLLALLDLEHGFDAGHALLERILLNHSDDPALVYALDRLSGEVPAEDLDLARALLAGHSRNGADQRRFTGGVERVHVGVGGHQVFSRGQRHVLDVLAVHRVEELDARARLSRRLEAIQALVLNKGIERADNADLGGAAHLVLCVIGEIFADLLAGPFVIDADESRIVAVGDTGVDRDDGNAGFLRRGDCRLHPLHVNGDQ